MTMIWLVRALFLLGLAIFFFGVVETALEFLAEDHVILYALRAVMLFALGSALMIVAIGCKIFFLDTRRS